jgi:hypothetical protein
MRRVIMVLAVFLPLGCASTTRVDAVSNHTATPVPDSAATPAHLAQAELLLSQLRPQDTEYRHSPSNVSFANTRHANAECRTDCSGFVTAILKHTYRLTDKDVRRDLGNERPLSEHYHAAIESGPAFEQVKHIQDARPGDIIAIRHPSDHRNNGHVMILAAEPRRREPTPQVFENTVQWDLDVIDCTEFPHSNDTRYQPKTDPRTGAGRGTFRLYTNERGEVVGHAWSDSPQAAFREQAERHLVIGRFQPDK